MNDKEGGLEVNRPQSTFFSYNAIILMFESYLL